MSHHLPSSRARSCIAILAVATLGVPSISHAQRAKPFATWSNPGMVLRDSVVAMARAQVGRKYRIGGATPQRGFDCSGLVKYVLETLKIEVPRTAREQSHIGSAIPRDTTELRPGDLLLFGRPKVGVSHVGIYVGNGRYIHASSIAGRVIESPLDRPPSMLIKPLNSARRILFGADPIIIATIVAKSQ